jgi:hypothetical protein
VSIDQQKELLAHAALRASNDPFFLGHELRAYREICSLDDEGVSKFLRCTPEALVRMSLCRTPEMNTTSFRHEVEQIAVYCGADPQRLAELLRHSDSVRSFRGVPVPVTMSPPAGMTVAARDRNPRKRRTRKKKPEK